MGNNRRAGKVQRAGMGGAGARARWRALAVTHGAQGTEERRKRETGSHWLVWVYFKQKTPVLRGTEGKQARRAFGTRRCCLG